MAGEAEFDPVDWLLAEVRELRERVEVLDGRPPHSPDPEHDPEHDRDVERAAQRLVERREGMSATCDRCGADFGAIDGPFFCLGCQRAAMASEAEPMSEEPAEWERNIRKLAEPIDSDEYGVPITAAEAWGAITVEHAQLAVVEIDRLRVALANERHFHQLLQERVAKVGAKLGHVGGAAIGDVDEGVDGLRANLDDAEGAREDAEAERDELRAALASAEAKGRAEMAEEAAKIVRGEMAKHPTLSSTRHALCLVHEDIFKEARGDDE
jgi:uncharacterized Zn finger protein (UPF0148 family)